MILRGEGLGAVPLKFGPMTSGVMTAATSGAVLAPAAEPEAAGRPAWLIPAAVVGGVGLVAVVLIMRRRSAAKNPHRRRRRARRARRR